MSVQFCGVCSGNESVIYGWARTDWNYKHGFAWLDKETRVSGFPLTINGNSVKGGRLKSAINRWCVRVFRHRTVPRLDDYPRNNEPVWTLRNVCKWVNYLSLSFLLCFDYPKRLERGSLLFVICTDPVAASAGKRRRSSGRQLTCI